MRCAVLILLFAVLAVCTFLGKIFDFIYIFNQARVTGRMPAAPPLPELLRHHGVRWASLDEATGRWYSIRKGQKIWL